MSHSVYVYLQQNDFAEIISLISSMHGIMISKKGEVIKPQFETIEDQVFSVFSNDTVSDNGFEFRQAEKYDHITVTQQQVLGGMLQPMNLTLITHQRNNDKSDEIVLLYNSIKKYIKKNYVISSDKMIFMGPQAYSEWTKRQFNTAFLFLLEKKVFYLSQTEFDLFLKWADSKSTVVDYTNRLYIRGRRAFDFEEYCITDNMSNILIRPTRINTMRVDSDSRCIYVSHELKGKKRTIVYIDKRIIDEQNEDILKLYDMIANYFTSIGV